MCEYDERCSKTDDPLAVYLWEHPTEAPPPVLTVLCPRKYCRLGVIYDLPQRGRSLVVPAFLFLQDAMFTNPDRGEFGHFHAATVEIPAVESPIEYGRCRCGTWCYDTRLVDLWLASWERADPARSTFRKETGNRSRPCMLASQSRMAEDTPTP